MRRGVATLALSGAVTVLTIFWPVSPVEGRAVQDPPPSTAAPASSPEPRPLPDDEPSSSDAPLDHGLFVGTWDYNAADSLNIRTGAPEQAQASATQRGRAGGTGPVAVPAPTGRAARGEGGPVMSGPPPTGLSVGPTADMIRESQILARDLLEIPETLRFAVQPDGVVITDDLGRERRYPTDGRRQRYQIAASQFQARVFWDGPRLRREIEGGFDFRMTETYFLSPDTKRLFVIVRVPSTRRGAPQTGFNRVYDRVEH